MDDRPAKDNLWQALLCHHQLYSMVPLDPYGTSIHPP